MARTTSRPNNGRAKALKNDFLRIRISTQEKDALTAEAAKEALDLSAWARRELLRAASLLPEAK